MEYGIVQLTKSKTRRAVLELFFRDPSKEYYLRQIEELINYSAGNIRREMIKLTASGLFIKRMLGKVTLYKLNTAHVLYKDIKNIVRKTIGLEGKLRVIAEKHKNIKTAFIYGSFAKGEERESSDIDIIIIGDIKPGDIKRDLYAYQSEIQREINSTVYSEEEFLDKVKGKNHFIHALIKGQKTFIKGTEDEFRRFVQIRKAAKA